MLRRSQVTQDNTTFMVTAPKAKKSASPLVSLPASFVKASGSERKRIVESEFVRFYEAPGKPLQVETVLSLAQSQNTFLLAGTGYGKTRIAELFCRLFKKSHSPLIMVLNPLDALGDNQVKEKKAVGMSAINLTKTTFNAEVAKDILKGVYQFIYLSPEIFLNNQLFDELYFCKSFQDRLVLKVVDEAHMIYSWGLVESGKSKKNVAHKRNEDRGFFRPSYGKLGSRLMATDIAPILLMSATCRPVAIHAILESLKLSESNVKMLHGELTRPEIRLMRVYMQRPLSTAQDLLRVIPKNTDVSDSEVAPMLVYSQTQNDTLTALRTLNQARGTPEDADNGTSTYARRFHAATGPNDKKSRVDDFASGKFRVMSCTMALGMGQNWNCCRQVIVMGDGDPSNTLQMLGRCGRDGRPGLGIMFVEEKRTAGRNSVADFGGLKVWSDDDRMDALRITPVCLRVAFTVDNTKGHIPVSFDDIDYIAERQRERAANMAVCQCSNCKPAEADRLFNYVRVLKESNFDQAVLSGIPAGVLIPPPISVTKPTGKGTKTVTSLPAHWAVPCPPTDPARSQPGLQSLAKSLLDSFRIFFASKFMIHTDLEPEDIFGDVQVWQVCKNYRQLIENLTLDSIMGDEMIEGTYSNILSTIEDWMGSGMFIQHQNALRAQEQVFAVAMARVQEEDAIKQAKKEALIQKKAILAQEKADRAQNRFDKKEAKRQRDEERRAFWAREAMVLADFKRIRYGESHSVRSTSFKFHQIISLSESLSLIFTSSFSSLSLFPDPNIKPLKLSSLEV